MLCCDQGFADGLALGCSGTTWSSCVCNASISLVQNEPSKAKLFYHSNLAADDYANCESPRDGLCRRPCQLWTASPLSLSSFQLRSALSAAPLTLPPLSLPPFQLWPALLQHSAVPIVVRAGQIGNLSAVYQKRLPNAKIGANFMGIMGADCPEVNATGCNFK